MQPGKTSGMCEFAWHPIRNAPHFESFPQGRSCCRSENGSPPNNPLYGVTNQLCENQWRIEPPGGIFPVRDLMLEFEWRPEASKPLGVLTRSGGQQFEVLFDPAQESVVVTSGNIQQQYDFKYKAKKTYEITVSLFDRHLLVAVNDAIIVEVPFNDLPLAEAGSTANKSPFAICLPKNDGVSQEEQEAAFSQQIANLRVWRDVYYTPKPGNVQVQTVTVPAGSYYLLGDNSSCSADSRHWNEPFVTHRRLVGIVAPFFR
jgi:hypothetical protein